MGIYQYVDPQTGRSYQFEHAGDAPTNEDFAFIRSTLERDRATYAQQFERFTGEEYEEPDDGTAIGRGFARGKKNLKQAFGETLGTIGEETGLGFLANYGQGLEERGRQELGELMLEQPERLQSTDVDSIGSAFRFAGETFGEQVPQLGIGLGAAAAAPLVGVSGFVGGVAVAGAATAPILFGNNIQRTEDVKGEGNLTSEDIYKALSATFGQAALEGIADKVLLGGVFRSLGKSIFTRTATRAGSGATTEGLTEVGQQMMERAQAGLPIDSEDAIAEYREAAIAGGLVGGGTRATLGAFGERDPDAPPITETTETGGTATGAVGQVGQDTQTTPQLQEGQTQGELFAVEPTEDAISVARTAIATDARLTDPNVDEDFIREELDQDYSPAVIEQIIAERRLAANAAQEKEVENAADPTSLDGKAQQTDEQRAAASAAAAGTNVTSDVALDKEQTILVNEQTRKQKKADAKAVAKTQDYLPGLEPQESGAAAIESEQTGQKIEVGKKGVETTETTEEAFTPDYVKNVLGVTRPAAPLLKAATKGNLSGKSLDDPAVVKRLANYVGNRGAESNAVVTSMEGRGFKYDEANNQFIRPESGAARTSVPDSRPSVDGEGGDGSRVESAIKPVSSESGSMGAGDGATVSSDVAAGKQLDTLEATPDAQGIEAVKQLAEKTTATPVDTSAMRQRAIGGAETAANAQLGPVPAPVQVPDAPQVQGASVSQEQLQAVEAERDAAAQARIDRIFENNRGKQSQVREYHDTQVDPQSAPEVTTAVDKEGILELLETSDDNLKGDANVSARAAKLFFKRFRRPVDALAEIGAIRVDGPTQSIEKDYTPVQFAFYKGMTQGNATQASLWVNNNLSRQARNEVRDAKIAARIDPNDNRSDAYLGVVKAAKSIQRKDNEALQKQMDRELDALKLEAQTRSPAELDQAQRGEGVVGAIKPIKGQTAFDSYMAGLGFKKRKVPKKDEYVYLDPKNENKPLTLEEVQEFYDGLAYTKSELGFLLIDPVHGLDQALLPSIKNALQRGDLQFALDAIASTSQVKRIREIAAKLGSVVSGTQVQVVDDISPLAGRKAAGLFSPEQNTIYIDANNGMNVHTILHEMTHAATSASIAANPSLPEVKQLQTILENIREQFGEIYGTANLDEFVAEAFSNPEFQSALALSKVDGGKMSGWEKFAGAVKRVVRKRLGLSPSPTALSEVDRLIEGLLSPSPATRAAPNMLLIQRTKEGATNLLRNHLTSVPLENKNRYEQARDLISANTPSLLKKFVLGVQPVNNLARLAKDKIPFANELNVLIDQASGALRKNSQPIDVIYNDYRAYRKANPEGYAKMQALMNRATQDEVDPARPRNTYSKYLMSYYDMKAEKTVIKEFDTAESRDAEVQRLNTDLEQKYANQDSPRSKAKKAGNPSDEKTAIWDTLNKEYKLLGKQGQDLYKITRDMGEAAQDRIMPAIKARIASLGIDAQSQKTAFEKLSDLLHAQGGVIRPYFKLGRDGDFRLSYHAPDPLRNGGIELFTEYYTTEKDLMQAQQNVIKYLEDIGRSEDINKIESGKRDAKRNYGSAPSSSFVFDVLSTLQAAGVDQASIDRIIDLSLDAIPERSFMQSFRSRKERSEGKRGILGALGDVTPSGMPGMEVDPAERFRDNFRGIEKQLIQLEYGARIQGFRNKLKDGGYFTRLDTADMAEKLDQIAIFAQAPSMARWSQIATSMGFAWTMGANVSSAINVMFDIPMAVHPYLAGEYGGRKATKAIADATKLFMGSPSEKMITVMGANGNLETRKVQLGKHNKGYDNHNFDDPNLDPETKKYKTLVEKAGARGMFNQSIDQEHVDLSDRRDVMAKINQVSGFLVHHGERFGRQISLLAAYDLELQKRSDNGKKELSQADFDAAAEKAMDTTELTLGSTASAGRPYWAQNPVGNVAFLFKRFAVSRYYFMAHLLDQSLAGADPETRKIARHQLAYFMLITGSLAGVGGLPLMGAAGAIYNMLADDDEDDFEAMMRKMLPNTMYDGLANELLGIDVASRVSMNSLLYRQPFIDKDQSALYTLFEQLGGPVVGTYLSVERGAGLWGEGNIQRGLEAMAPAAIRNVSKFQRFSTEGANTLRGNPIVDDINPYNSFMQLLGFAPADYVENLKINSSERRRQNVVNKRRANLLRRHNMARVEGDIDGVRKALQDINEYNDSLPEVYQKDSRIDSNTITKSLKGFIKTTGNMVNGIVYTDAMRESAEDYK